MGRKILYIGGFELPDRNAAAQRVIANAQAMREAGFEVILLGLSRSAKNGKFFVKGFECYEMQYPTNFLKWLFFLFNNKAENKLINQVKCDSIVLYNYPAFKFYYLLYRYGTSKRIYADVTEWYEVQGFSLSSLIKRFDVWFRMKKLHPKISGLIVISDFLESYYKPLIKNIINIPPLVDSSDKKWSLVNGQQTEAKGLNLIYAGSPGGGQKDRLDLVINVVKELIVSEKADIKLDIVGVTQEEFQSNFKISNNDYLAEFRDHIVFHGRVSHSDALEFLKKADYSVFFRDNNLTNTAGFPTKFVEAVTAGTLVITNFSSNLKTYFEKYPSIGVGINSVEFDSIKMTLIQALKKTRSEINESKLINKELRIFDFNNHVYLFKKLLS